jgi:hypothetical protein
MKTNITMVYEINGEVTENISGDGIEFHSEASDETDIRNTIMTVTAFGYIPYLMTGGTGRVAFIDNMCRALHILRYPFFLGPVGRRARDLSNMTIETTIITQRHINTNNSKHNRSV